MKEHFFLYMMSKKTYIYKHKDNFPYIFAYVVIPPLKKEVQWLLQLRYVYATDNYNIVLISGFQVAPAKSLWRLGNPDNFDIYLSENPNYK
jgi:hypothetical protein